MCQMHLEKRFKLREMNVRHHTCNGNKNLHKLVLTATKGSATLYLAGQQAHLNQSYRLPSTLKLRSTLLSTSKDQIIWKDFLASSNSPKKWTNEFVIVVVKTNLFICFLGEFEDTKSPYKIIWPLPTFFFSKHKNVIKVLNSRTWLTLKTSEMVGSLNDLGILKNNLNDLKNLFLQSHFTECSKSVYVLTEFNIESAPLPAGSGAGDP